MQERMRDLRRPVLVAVVVVAAMLAAFTVTRTDAASSNAPQRAVPNQTIQSESAPDDDGDGHDCPEKGGRGGYGGGGSAPAPQQSAPATPTDPGTSL